MKRESHPPDLSYKGRPKPEARPMRKRGRKSKRERCLTKFEIRVSCLHCHKSFIVAQGTDGKWFEKLGEG